MSWKLLQPRLASLQGWELTERELPSALRVFAHSSLPAPPFFSHLHSHLCPAPASQSRLRRFLRKLDATSPSVFLFSALKAAEEIRTPMKPNWKLTREDRIALLLATHPLISKTDCSREAKEIVSALCEQLIAQEGSTFTAAEAATVLLTFREPLEGCEALQTALEIATAEVVNSALTLDGEVLTALRKAVRSEMLHAIFAEAERRKVEEKQKEEDS